MAERFVRRFRKGRIGVSLIIRPEQKTDAEKCQNNRDVGETRHDQRTPAPTNVRRGQHPLHHVLISAVRGHGNKCRSDQSGKNRVLGLKHSLDFFPARLRWIKTRGQKIGNAESTMALHDFVPAAGDCRVKQSKGNKGAADHDRGLN